jgi:hypothetical protein
VKKNLKKIGGFDVISIDASKAHFEATCEIPAQEK